MYRNIMEKTIYAAKAYRGVGEIGFDFWPVLDGARGRKQSIMGRFGTWGNINISSTALMVVPPGPAGAISSKRFEMFLEGIQEVEARIFIEKALDDPTQKARLGAGLAARCEKTLDERAHVLGNLHLGSKEGDLWFAASGWQERSRDLYETAAEVAKALAGK